MTRPHLTLITNGQPQRGPGRRKRSHLTVVRWDGSLDTPDWAAVDRRRFAKGEADAIAEGIRQAEADMSRADWVAAFLRDCCAVTPATYGQKLDEGQCTGRRDLATAFNAWAEDQGGPVVGERWFFACFSQLDGITEVRHGHGIRSYNVTLTGTPVKPSRPVRLPVAAVMDFGPA